MPHYDIVVGDYSSLALQIMHGNEVFVQAFGHMISRLVSAYPPDASGTYKPWRREVVEVIRAVINGLLGPFNPHTARHLVFALIKTRYCV